GDLEAVEETGGNAEGADRVPDAQELHADGAGVRLAEQRRRVRIGRVIEIAVERVGIRHAVEIRHESALAQHADEATGGVGAAAEAEDAELVPLPLVVGDELVAAPD